MIYGLLEIEIMNALWSIQEKDEDACISIADIVEELKQNEVYRAYTTVKTVMDRLVAKDILVRYRDGKKFFYGATVDRVEASREAVQTIANQFFGGDKVKMLRFIERECEHLLV